LGRDLFRPRRPCLPVPGRPAPKRRQAAGLKGTTDKTTWNSYLRSRNSDPKGDRAMLHEESPGVKCEMDVVKAK
jgi:hypothetical protein